MSNWDKPQECMFCEELFWSEYVYLRHLKFGCEKTTWCEKHDVVHDEKGCWECNKGGVA